MVLSVEVNPTSFSNEPPAKAAARILISKNNYLDLTKSLDNGRLCVIEGPSTEAGAPVVRREAVLWASPESLGKTVVRVSKAFREAAGLSLSGKWRITVAPKLANASEGPSGEVLSDSIPVAREITVEELLAGSSGLGADALPRTPSKTPVTAMDVADVPSWVDRTIDVLCMTEVVFPGLTMAGVRRWKERRSFRIRAIDGREDNVALFVAGVTQVSLVASEGSSFSLPLRLGPSSPRAPSTPATPAAVPPSTPVRGLAKAAVASQQETPPQRPRGSGGHVRLAPIDGLEKPVAALNEFLSEFDPFVEGAGLYRHGAHNSVVLQGDHGTGKTMLLERVAATGWGSVHHVDPDDKLSTITEIFRAAFEQRPSIVLLDDLHKLLTVERANPSAFVRKLGKLLDQYLPNGSGDDDEVPQIMVLASCLDYQKDIPEDLRTPDRFDSVISVPFPDAAMRLSILRSFRMPLPPHKADTMLTNWSQRTHAFNAHDLRRLRKLVERKGRVRLGARREDSHGSDGDGGQDRADDARFLTEEDFNAAREEVGPSRMNGVDIKPLPVYWRQIHGQEELVYSLREAVDTINHPERYETIVPQSRGYLLYGPPGCSKTMAAQALATEGGLNYFSVKGGELLNQYVGESERGIRDLFARAKKAEPAVIFLDEIDALGGRRADFGDKSAASGRGPQMVPALLSELDGFEARSKVIVVAATNRPEALDPALLRPGRLETHLYVAPPDTAARRAILADWAAQVAPHFANGPALFAALDHFAERTDGYSGAEIRGLCQKVGQAANRAANRSAYRSAVDQDFSEHHMPTFTTELMESVVAHTRKMITPQILRHFEKWSVE